MKPSHLRSLLLAAIFAGIAVVGSMLSFPVLGARCAPVQHLVNVLCAVLLGTRYGVGAAFAASLLRNLLGLGTPLAFPGSMCGAFLSAFLYEKTRSLPAAYAGEIIGTGLIGGLLAYPVATYILGSSAVSLFAFVFPFLVSTIGGTALAAFMLGALGRLPQMERGRR